MKHLLISIIVFCALMNSSLIAQEKKIMNHTMKGYLVDNMCASLMVKGSPESAMIKAAKHTRSCAMEKECAKSGYSIISDGNWYKFDEGGKKKAVEFLRKLKKKDNLYVEVSGMHDGELLMVSSIKEAKPEMSKKIQ